VTAQTEIGTGSEFVGYRIDELIGRGGMGVVYRAFDLRLKRTVALKLMAPELALDPRFRERFAREMELAMSLEHPNVVPIHDAGDVDGRLYLAMRYVEGTDLRLLLHAEGVLDEARSLAVCSQVANALDAAHAKGLVHRDVKPSNVLLDAAEHVYLADFGLTRRLDEQGGAAGEHRSVGTPAYLAPEQIEGGPIDGRTDVYSLGCLLFECLTGETPFVRASRLAVAWAHLEEEPPRASDRRPELPQAIDAVIRNAMAKERENRYTTCTSLVTAANEALGLRRPKGFLRRRRGIMTAAAVPILSAAALAAFVLVRSTEDGGAAAPNVTPDTLVRIDAATNQLDAVVAVGPRPTAIAVGGRSIWVYNDDGPSVSEIDAATAVARHTTPLAGGPGQWEAVSGPVLAADTAGAWVVGVDARRRPYLTRVFSGARGKREYRLGQEAFAVAAGYGAVWVVTRGAHDDQLLRIDPATGKATKRTRFPRSSAVAGLAVGLGGVWVVTSTASSGTLYEIAPRSARVTSSIDFAERVTRPVVRLGRIWVGQAGNQTVLVDPVTSSVVRTIGCCAPEKTPDAAEYGSIWSFDTPTGTVERWESQTYQPVVNIRVAAPPFYDGLCLTSIATGGGAVWVTAAATVDHHC
jgi:hypothetical protein